jgi:hypothetical protein
MNVWQTPGVFAPFSAYDVVLSCLFSFAAASTRLYSSHLIDLHVLCLEHLSTSFFHVCGLEPRYQYFLCVSPALDFHRYVDVWDLCTGVRLQDIVSLADNLVRAQLWRCFRPAVRFITRASLDLLGCLHSSFHFRRIVLKQIEWSSKSRLPVDHLLASFGWRELCHVNRDGGSSGRRAYSNLNMVISNSKTMVSFLEKFNTLLIAFTGWTRWSSIKVVHSASTFLRLSDSLRSSSRSVMNSNCALELLEGILFEVFDVLR